MRIKYLSPAFLCYSGLIMLCVATGLSGQEIDPSGVILNSELPGEKVYLHIDRPDYMQGDTIWFKAYVWYGYDQYPDTLSKVLYVDLLNSGGSVIASRKLALEYGTTWGEFALEKNTKPGDYTLRSYTRLMQYAGGSNPFYQTITINAISQDLLINYTPLILKRAGTDIDSLRILLTLSEVGQTGEQIRTNSHEVDWTLRVGSKLQKTGNLLAKNSVEYGFSIGLEGVNPYDTLALLNISVNVGDSIIKEEFSIPLLERIDLQFFPEGGKMVTGIQNNVAFKAIGTDGLSREVLGEIVDGDGVRITTFETIHKGMGSFLLKPEPQKAYFAVLNFNDRMFRIKIPESTEEGCSMFLRFHGIGIGPYLTLRYSPSEENQKKYIAASSYGEIRFLVSIVTPKDSCKIQLPANRFQEGITRLTVLDSNYEPECERIFYSNNKQRFNINAFPDSTSYRSRSKVTLLIKTTNRIDNIPLQTELSISVTDKELAGDYKNISGISTYKLLESELKGSIEEPDYYFSNEKINFTALDLLMLTQGYRTFAKPSETKDPDLLQPEREYKIDGKLELTGNQKNFDFREIDMQLLIISEKTGIFQFKPDSLGYFKFNSPIPYGKPSALVQATNAKGKPFKGFLSLNDSIPSVKFDLVDEPILKNISPSISYVQQLQEIKKIQMSKDLIKGARVVDLPEIIVKGRSKNWFLDFEKNAKMIVDLDSIDPTGKSIESIYDVLVRDFGARWHTFNYQNTKTVLLPALSVLGPDYWLPIYVVNESAWFDGTDLNYLSLISYFPVNEIKKLMVVPPGDIADFYSNMSYKITGVKQSLVVIETYPNWSYRGDPTGIKSFIMNGLDKPREFYSPKYEGTLKDNSIYDSRATLFWDPDVETDENGEAKVEFYTSDRNTTFQVNINGIEVNSGQPGQGSLLLNYESSDRAD